MITESLSVEEIAASVCSALAKAGISAVLTGGAVVSIYADNPYHSYDLDFVVEGIAKKTDAAMESVGFRKNGRHFVHRATKYIVEFPAGPLAIGETPVSEVSVRRTKLGMLRLLSATDCVMDRLAAFYHWDDKQALDQALRVAKSQKVNLSKVRRWSIAEGMRDKYQHFRKSLL